jgi:hypothetical protein
MLKAIGILKSRLKELKGARKIVDMQNSQLRLDLPIKNIEESIKELEEYEQKFRDKEFKYRTDCQNVLSAGRVEADNMPDKLAELEKVILDYYLAKGYQVGVGGWAFKVNISTLHKIKDIQIMFRQDICSNWETIFRMYTKTTNEMWDEAIEYFRSGK